MEMRSDDTILFCAFSVSFFCFRCSCFNQHIKFQNSSSFRSWLDACFSRLWLGELEGDGHGSSGSSALLQNVCRNRSIDKCYYFSLRNRYLQTKQLFKGGLFIMTTHQSRPQVTELMARVLVSCSQNIFIRKRRRSTRCFFSSCKWCNSIDPVHCVNVVLNYQPPDSHLAGTLFVW